ncbi:MAG: hypothetical protein ACKVOW_11535 [Chitinophagaceae bacterium]
MAIINYASLADGGSSNNDMEPRLWDFIDGNCSSNEKSFIEQLIATNLQWKTKYEQLLEVNHLIKANLELDQPSLRFSRNVMEEIGRCQITPAAKTYINKKIIWGITIFFLTMILGTLIYGLGQLNWTATSNSDSLLGYKIPTIEWSKFFNNTYTTVFLMVNTILGMMLLDMYLGKKKKQWQEKNS